MSYTLHPQPNSLKFVIRFCLLQFNISFYCSSIEVKLHAALFHRSSVAQTCAPGDDINNDCNIKRCLSLHSPCQLYHNNSVHASSCMHICCMRTTTVWNHAYSSLPITSSSLSISELIGQYSGTDFFHTTQAWTDGSLHRLWHWLLPNVSLSLHMDCCAAKSTQVWSTSLPTTCVKPSKIHQW